VTGLPIADPQFWVVTLVVLVALGWSLRRLLRNRAEASRGACSHCPPAAQLRRDEPKTADQRESTSKGSPAPLP
jgi:hypothetical protein